jgi:F-type H+-transporting ATPase subunit delta
VALKFCACFSGKVNQAKRLTQLYAMPGESLGTNNENRLPVANSASPVSAVAKRYAGSLFDLALESKSVALIEKDLGRMEALIKGSADLSRLMMSPVFSADDQVKAVSSISTKAKLGTVVGNFLRVAARNRRLSAVPGMITAFRQIAAEHRGEPVHMR